MKYDELMIGGCYLMLSCTSSGMYLCLPTSAYKCVLFDLNSDWMHDFYDLHSLTNWVFTPIHELSLDL